MSIDLTFLGKLIKDNQLHGIEVSIFKAICIPKLLTSPEEQHETIKKESLDLTKDKGKIILDHLKKYPELPYTLPNTFKQHIVLCIQLPTDKLLEIIDLLVVELPKKVKTAKKRVSRLSPITKEQYLETLSKMKEKDRIRLMWRDEYFQKLVDKGITSFDCENPSCSKKNLLPFEYGNVETQITLDHITPASWDRETFAFDENNVQHLCHKCNTKKSNIKIEYRHLTKDYLSAVYGVDVVNNNWDTILKLISKFLNVKTLYGERVKTIELIYIDNRFAIERRATSKREVSFD